ncbi:GNAT family N-acetyltransferase [Candidatus Stoquefichus massiliensis]|uniref:GNAT family N-acetyltransferase n=1 Tax=Candidatus Stoquefichus massiliensis TaxID=1470350 RepID=UPI0004832E47|nr:GNAT family N-acetyltransferase [Candidatus Stoquefichus massiliensis]
MLKYQRITEADKELYHFCLEQKEYYKVENQEVTWEYVQSDMLPPKGFEKEEHYHYKIYDQNDMIGYIDYLIGYRYHMLHDDSYMWIGLFLVNQNQQRQHYGKRIIEYIINKHPFVTHIQLACLQNNFKGLAFWNALGFQPISQSSYKSLNVTVFEKERNTHD